MKDLDNEILQIQRSKTPIIGSFLLTQRLMKTRPNKKLKLLYYRQLELAKKSMFWGEDLLQ